MFYWIFPKKVIPILQGDGDYEFVKGVIFDDYLLKRITKVSCLLID